MKQYSVTNSGNLVSLDLARTPGLVDSAQQKNHQYSCSFQELSQGTFSGGGRGYVKG